MCRLEIDERRRAGLARFARGLNSWLEARRRKEKRKRLGERGFGWGLAGQQARRGAPRSPCECFAVRLVARFFQVSMKLRRVFGRVSEDVSIRGRIESNAPFNCCRRVGSAKRPSSALEGDAANIHQALRSMPWLSFHHIASARTTDVSIWRSGTVQYCLRRRSFSGAPTI